MKRLPPIFPLLALLLVWPAVAALRAAELELAVVDDVTGQPTAVRVHLRDARGRTPQIKNVVAWKDHFVFAGRTILELPPGKYTFEIERGPEFRPHAGHFELKKGDADNKEVRMVRFADLKQEGWWSGETHIHRAPEDIELLMLAEDLHVAPVITWWNDKNAWAGRPAPKELLRKFDENRYYHLMAGEDERGGGALLFFQLPQPLEIGAAMREFPSAVGFLEAAKKQPGVHVDLEKPFWLDAPTWIATGLVDSVGLAHNHYWRDGQLANEAWGKARNPREFSGARGNADWTNAIYYHLLNCGLRLPPSAGSASGVLPNPVGYNRAYVHCGDDFSYEKWWAGLKAGRVVVTNGPLLRPFCEGHPPGHVFTARQGEKLELHIALKLSTRDPVDYLEIIQDGRVLREVRLDEVAARGGELPPVVCERSGWFLVRAVSSGTKTYRFASSGPWYVDVGGEPRISKASAQFFLDWVYSRAATLDLPDGDQKRQVLETHRRARDFWRDLVARANAD